MTLTNWINKNALLIVFVQAVAAMLGSLYFSEIRGFPPCILCWYQRIAMYPIVAIAAVGIWFNDLKAYRYILPLSIAGGLVAVYQNLLYYNILPEAVAPCTLGVSCTTKYIQWFGFVTIPLLSLLAFAVITAVMLLQRQSDQRSKTTD
ncbi:disulfide bond formation protein B [Candidatus Uhrbacteria bacterium]|nr:disulfide bond formation protein B [Candidatus Uhrbacteria bacterium]